MTYEKGLLAQADLRIVRGSTIERKKMSTKTLRKRVALTAVIALVTGLVSVAPANAVAGDWFDGGVTGGGVVTISGNVDQNASVTAVIDKYLTINHVFQGDSASYTMKSTGTGSLFGKLTLNGAGLNPLFEATNGLDETATNGLFTGLEADDDVTIKATSSTAGTQTITFVPQTAGSTSVTSKLTITWVATATAALSAANTAVYAATTGTCAADLLTRTLVAADKAAKEITSESVANGVDICVAAFDGAGSAATPDSVTVIGSLGGGDTGIVVADNSPVAENDNPSIPGKAVYTVIITLDDAVVSKTVNVDFFDVVKTIGLENVTFAAAADGTVVGDITDTAVGERLAFDSLDRADAAENDIGTAGSAVGLLSLVGKDKNGILADASGAGIDFTVDSDIVAGAPTGLSDAVASVVLADDVASGFDAAGVADLANLGGNAVVVICGTSAEKLTITANGFDSDGADIKSSAVTFYCAGSVDTISVTGTATAVTAKAVDASKYPVADGTSVTFAASNGSVVSPSSKLTSNGMASVTFIQTSSAANSSVSALVGSKSGTSAALAGSGSSSSAQIKSLVKKINALTKLIAKIQKKLGVK